MSTTFIFEELDDATREYLTVVRDNEGAGSPGVFVPTSDTLPGCGCIAGPIVIILTVIFTFTTAIGVIYNEPLAVACLQTAGLLLGMWLLLAKFRGKGGRNAGTWVYVDPLHLYEAFREQVTVTRIDEVADANYTHNYDSNGNYQNSVINIAFGRKGFATVTINNESRAEYMVTYLNYLAWARGPEGGERADLNPADLGGLARFVVRNGDEPKDAENNINLNLVELDITEVPEEPTREGRALPAILPYAFMFAFALLCFVVLGFGINPVLRDDAIYERSVREPQQPAALRAYFLVPKNKMHREEVLAKLPRFYAAPIDHVEKKATDKQLGRGMGDILRALSTAEQPAVSLRVTETRSPPGETAESKSARENKLRTEFAEGVIATFAHEPWGKQVLPPPETEWVSTTDPPPLGYQLIAFVEPPEGDANGQPKPVHFEIAYELKPAAGDQYTIEVHVRLKADVTKDDVAQSLFTVPGTFSAAALDSAMFKVRDELLKRMVGPLPPNLPNQ
ncbi:MAG TPA: hypothetical protein VGE74_13915 [Gemmata sp.]